MISTLGWVFASLFLLAVAGTRTYYALERGELVELILYGSADLFLALATILFWAFSPRAVGILPIVLAAFGVIALMAGGVLEASSRARRLQEEASFREAEFLRRMRVEQQARGGRTGES